MYPGVSHPTLVRVNECTVETVTISRLHLPMPTRLPVLVCATSTQFRTPFSDSNFFRESIIEEILNSFEKEISYFETISFDVIARINTYRKCNFFSTLINATDTQELVGMYPGVIYLQHI
jgi:hypothetical protein